MSSSTIKIVFLVCIYIDRPYAANSHMIYILTEIRNGIFKTKLEKRRAIIVWLTIFSLCAVYIFCHLLWCNMYHVILCCKRPIE